MYSWVDADGVKHFTNRTPPENATAVRHVEEIPYEEAVDREREARDARYFDQQAVENTLRRLRQTERALSESLDRAREAERRADERNAAYEYEYDDPYYWGTSYGGYYDDDYDRRYDDDRRDGLNGDRRRSRGHGRSPKHHGYRSERGRHRGGDYKGWRSSKSKRARYHEHRSRQRLSKRERGVASGLTRVVRAIPSPYYMGYRPVRSRDASYRSHRGGHGRRGYHRGGGGSRRSGGRVRVRF